MADKPRRSGMGAAAYVAIAGLQIWSAVIVFSKWNEDDVKDKGILHNASTTTTVGKSYYKNSDGNMRGKWEMKEKVSTLYAGNDYDAYAVRMTFPDSTSLATNNNCMYADYDVWSSAAATYPRAAGLTCFGTSENHPTGRLHTIKIGGGILCTGHGLDGSSPCIPDDDGRRVLWKWSLPGSHWFR